MEPVKLSDSSPAKPALVELAMDLAARSAGLRRGLPQGIVSSLATLVRSMNCYYSNLIEGYDTHPIEIERALQNDFSANPRQRHLQLEARAHIEVQEWIDAGGIDGRASTIEGLLEIHRRFYEQLPEDLLLVNHTSGKDPQRVQAGSLRDRDVRVGSHIPVSPGAVPRFLRRFEEVFGSLRKAETVIAAPAAHHRLLWIHPFLDGNGRVARLMSYAQLRESLGTGGLWSIARGLARRVSAYKAHLANCDPPRRNDLDGRGNLSEEELAAFSAFFLETCLDQINFMEHLMQPDRLRVRVLNWCDEEIALGDLPAKSRAILEAILHRGELERAEIVSILGTTDRQARRVTSALISCGSLASDSPKGSLRLAFPARLAPRWMPGLFPEEPAGAE